MMWTLCLGGSKRRCRNAPQNGWTSIAPSIRTIRLPITMEALSCFHLVSLLRQTLADPSGWSASCCSFIKAVGKTRNRIWLILVVCSWSFQKVKYPLRPQFKGLVPTSWSCWEIVLCFQDSLSIPVLGARGNWSLTLSSPRFFLTFSFKSRYFCLLFFWYTFWQQL